MPSPIPPRTPRRLLDSDELKARLPIGRTTFYELIKDPEFPAPVVLREGGDYFWFEDEFEEWLETRRRHPGHLMYKSELVPRRMAMLGLIGGPILILSFLLTLADVYKNGEGPSGLFTLPEAAWELSLGIYCAWKGFRTESWLAQPQAAVA